MKKKNTKKDSPENNKTSEQASPNTIETIQAKPNYNYELKIMNTKNLYNDSNIVIYVKTDNPNTSTIKADCGQVR